MLLNEKLKTLCSYSEMQQTKIIIIIIIINNK